MAENDSRTVTVESMRRVGTLVDLVTAMPKKDPRYALFLGAGASISSGIPAAGKLIALWQRRVFLDKTARTTWRPQYEDEFRRWVTVSYPTWRRDWENVFGRHPSDYSVLFSYVCPDADARQGFIERVISGCEPGPGYIYLSALAIAGYFHTFITTNFDDLIHDALFRYGGLKPVVSAFDSQVASVRLQSPRPKIIKLHGDFLFNNIRNVGPEVARLDRNMEDKFERTCESYGLVVLGYSGQDHSVMAPLRALLHRRDRLTHGLHWCVYQEPTRRAEPTRWIPEELYRMWEAYPDKVHLYDVGSFDEVMEAFYSGGNCNPPPDLAHPEDKALYARLRDGLENADQTWRLNPEFSRLLEHFRVAATKPPPAAAIWLDEADQLHRDGVREMKAKNYQQAQLAFQTAVEKAGNAAAKADSFQKVRALRRLAGSRSSLAEVIVKQSGRKGAHELPETEAAIVRDIVLRAIEEAREGLAVDRQLSSPPELRGHRINLWFNGLACYGCMQQIEPAFVLANRVEALLWLERLASDEFLGDEYVRLLADEIGGPELLDELRREPTPNVSITFSPTDVQSKASTPADAG